VRGGVRVVELRGITYHLNVPSVQALLRMLRLADYPADGATVPEMLVFMTSETAYTLSTMELIKYRKVGSAIYARFTLRGLITANMLKTQEGRRLRALQRAR
jgi:hypothetical protein